MARTKQNQVPYEFDPLYGPILKLKKLFQSKAKELKAEDTVQGLVMLHFATFIMTHLHKQLRLSTTKNLIIRELIELVMSGDSYKLHPDQLARLFSYIDSFGKLLNITHKAYIYNAMYQAYLDSEIYRLIHPVAIINEFIHYHYILPETAKQMKIYYYASLEVLKKLNCSTNRRSIENVKVKLNINDKINYIKEK